MIRAVTTDAHGVWLVIGVQAAGKSTVADLLAREFDRGVPVRGLSSIVGP